MYRFKAGRISSLHFIFHLLTRRKMVNSLKNSVDKGKKGLFHTCSHADWWGNGRIMGLLIILF